MVTYKDVTLDKLLVLQFFSEYPAMGVHPLLLEWHGSVMTPDRRCRAVLKEFTDGVDLAELGRKFQSETVLGKKKTYRHQHETVG